MMMGSKSDAVVLPLVARNVQTPNAALNAANSEGADFLIYGFDHQDNHFDLDIKINSGFDDVKIPMFVTYSSRGKAATPVTEALKFLKSGASGLVLSLEDLRLFNDDALSQLFNIVIAMEKKSQGELESINNLELLDVENDTNGKTKVAGFVKLEDREKHLVETEKSVLLEAINIIQKATPLVIFYLEIC